MKLPPLPRSVLGWIIPAIVGVGVWYVQARVVWNEGFDTGAAYAQCLDYVAILGDDEATKSEPCRTAHDRHGRFQTKLFARVHQ